MYNIGFWSLSSHLQNRIIPSIKENKKINPVAIFSTKVEAISKIKYLENIKIYNDKKKFLLDKNYQTLYISSITSEHFKNCLEALIYKKNIICEKRIALNSKQIKILIKLAKQKNVFIHEMYQYKFHPLFLKIKDILKKNTLGKIKKVESKFTIPLNDIKNFRFNNRLGGGSLNDVGVYPISLNIFLFEKLKPTIIRSDIFKSKIKSVDISGKTTTKIDNFLFNHHWGFDKKYNNYLSIKGSIATLHADFIYSKKNDTTGKILIVKNEIETKIITKKANQINLAFNYYLANTNTKEEDSHSIAISDMIRNIKLLSIKKLK